MIGSFDASAKFSHSYVLQLNSKLVKMIVYISLQFILFLSFICHSLSLTLAPPLAVVTVLAEIEKLTLLCQKAFATTIFRIIFLFLFVSVKISYFLGNDIDDNEK